MCFPETYHRRGYLAFPKNHETQIDRAGREEIGGKRRETLSHIGDIIRLSDPTLAIRTFSKYYYSLPACLPAGLLAILWVRNLSLSSLSLCAWSWTINCKSERAVQVTTPMHGHHTATSNLIELKQLGYVQVTSGRRKEELRDILKSTIVCLTGRISGGPSILCLQGHARPARPGGQGQGPSKQ